MITKNGFNKKSGFFFFFLVNGDGGLAASRPMVTQTKHIPTDMLDPALLKSGIGRRWWKEVDCLDSSVSEFSCHDKAKNDLLIVTLMCRVLCWRTDDVTCFWMWAEGDRYVWFCFWQEALCSSYCFVIHMAHLLRLRALAQVFTPFFISLHPLISRHLPIMPLSPFSRRGPTCCMATTLTNLPHQPDWLHHIMSLSQPNLLQTCSYCAHCM